MATDEEILDATLEQIALTGVRRTSADDLARRAGVNRATLYRRFGNKDGVVAAAYLHEAQRVLRQIDTMTSAVPGPGEQPSWSPEKDTVAFFTATVTALRENVLLQRLLAVDPDETLAGLTVGAGDVLTLGAGVLAQRITAMHRWMGRKPLPPGQLDALCFTLARLTQSFLLTPDVPPVLDTGAACGRYARLVVVPLVLGSR